MNRIPALALVLTLFVIASLVPGVSAAPDPGDINVHDPMMIKQGNTYYVFSTGQGIEIRTSTTMHTWNYVGTVFDSIPGWVTNAVGPITDLWAPNVTYWGGLYHLYYAGSQFGTNTSVIGLATSPTLDPNAKDYRWTDRGEVVSTVQGDFYNAIDPSVVFDTAGVPWLVFGSFWSGIKALRLDPATGKPSRTYRTLYSLAYRPSNNAIEAPYIVHRGSFYYLFVSFDFCCRGIHSTYRIMVGRSTNVTGPYADTQGKPMMQGGATQILAGKGRMRGPGGQSVFVQNGVYWLVYHYYDARDNGASKLQISRLEWSANGWPRVAPGSNQVPWDIVLQRTSVFRTASRANFRSIYSHAAGNGG